VVSAAAAEGLRSGWAAAAPLRHIPAYRRLLAGQMGSQLADGLIQIAFAQVILFEAGRGATPFEIAKLLAVTLLPYSIVGPVAGVVIDRFDRRRVLVAVSGFRALLAASAVAVVLAESQPLAYVYVLVLLSSSRFVLAAKGAALPNTVEQNDLVTANAVSSIAGGAAVFVGAVAGSTFVAVVPWLGAALAAVFYATAVVAFGGLRHIGGGGSGESIGSGIRRVYRELADGLGFIAHSAPVRRPLLAVAANRMLLGAGFILLVLVADDRYSMEAPGYGLALAVTGVGAFVGTWAAPVLAGRFHRRSLLPLTFGVGVAAAAVGAQATALVPLVIGVGFVAFAFQVLKVLTDALVQESTPDRVRGRVFSVYDLLYNVSFIVAALVLVPLWSPGRESSLLWLLSVAFAVAGAAVAARSRVWPFEASASGEGSDANAAPRRPALRLVVWGACVVAGALPALAFPATDLWVLAFVGFVPLLALVVRAPDGRAAVARVFAGGVGFFLAAYHWLVPTVGPFVVLLAVLFAALWIPWGWLGFRLLRGRPTGGAVLVAVLVVPSAWTLAEFLRSWEGLGGPWALLGAALWSTPRLGASASIGGIWLTGFLLAAVNVAVSAALGPRARTSARLVGVAVAAGLVVAMYLHGALRPAPEPLPGSPTITVGGVQTGLVRGADERFDTHVEMTAELLDDDVDLVVWAESSVGFDLEDRPEELEQLASLSEAVGAPILVNVDARRGEGGIFKSSVLVDSSGVVARYDKRRLVPFGEYIPARSLLGWMAEVTDAADENRRRGESLAVMELDPAGNGAGTDGGPGRSTEAIGVGPLVCFESAFPDLTRELTRMGADLVVPQTATTTFQGSWAQEQHASLAAVRAVEVGRPVVHAAVSGVSAAFDAEGRELARMGSDEAGTWTAHIPLVGGTTPYVRFGDWVPVACVLVLVTAAMAAGLRAARR
jgi:apolipoprotein N-acyltransferase